MAARTFFVLGGAALGVDRFIEVAALARADFLFGGLVRFVTLRAIGVAGKKRRSQNARLGFGVTARALRLGLVGR